MFEFNSYITTLILFNLVISQMIVYVWKSQIYLKLGLKQYQAIQRIHEQETPRLGGLVYIISLIIFAFSFKENEASSMLKTALISLAPVFLIALKEDLFHNTKPKNRFIALIFSACLFFLIYSGPLPDLHNIPLVTKLLSFKIGIFIVLILGIITAANGMNLIDGVHGLCGFSALAILGALSFLAHTTSDHLIFELTFNLILLFLPFIIFNYPCGKIFLGDLGAYGLGFLLSVVTIIFFGRHPDLTPWLAVLILSYPLMEASFSFTRRLLNQISVTQPDIAHIHLKLFYFLKRKKGLKKIANPLVAPLMIFIWLFPLLSILMAYKKENFIFISIGFFLFFYFFFWYLISNIQQKKFIKND